MNKYRNTQSGHFTTKEETLTNPNGTVTENARKYIAELRLDEPENLESEAFICGVEKALSFFSK